MLPKPDYELLLKAWDDNIAKMKLQPVPWFIGKIIQVQNLLNAISSIYSICHVFISFIYFCIHLFKFALIFKHLEGSLYMSTAILNIKLLENSV